MSTIYIPRFAVALIALCVYLRTLCRTVYVGDSGELIAAVHTLGIAHPPGYPLYILLGKGFSILIPRANPALRLNLFSAFCAAAAATVCCITLQSAGFPAFLAVAVALTVAFGASLWSQATIARVYAPAALAVSLIFYFFVRWDGDPAQSYWLAAAFAAAGAGIALHPAIASALLALFITAAFQKPALLTDARSLALVACLLPGVALYAWIPLRARSRPAVRWGNLRTKTEIIRFFTRRDYWKYRHVRSLRQAFQVLAFYIHRITREYTWLGALAIALGLARMARTSPTLLLMAALTAAFNTFAMIAHARREDIFHWPRYMIPTWLALTLPLAAGWSWLITFLPPAAQLPCAFLLPTLLMVTGFQARNLSNHRFADAYNRKILRDLPPNAILIASDDNVLFPLMYFKHALNLRPDVTLIDQAARDAGPLTFNPRRDAVYSTHRIPALECPATGTTPGLTMVPEGLTYRLISTGMQYTPRDFWTGQEVMPPANAHADFLTRRLVANQCIMHAEWESTRNPAQSKTWCLQAIQTAWDCPTVLHNAGVLLAALSFAQDAAHCFDQATRLEGNHGKWSKETG